VRRITPVAQGKLKIAPINP